MKGVRLLVSAALLLGCAGPTPDVSPPSSTTRPPLASPPDPGPAPTDDQLGDELRARVSVSTVRVFGIACGRSSEGSGFAVGTELIVTNAHVVLGVAEPVVSGFLASERKAIVVAFDPTNDLAVLRVPGAGFEPLPLAEATDGTVGGVFGWEPGPELVISPFRIDRPVTVRTEAVGSTERVRRPAYLVAADIESGDSGAALVNAEGAVVGVAYATTTRNASVGYAVRSEAVAPLVADASETAIEVPDCR